MAESSLDAQISIAKMETNSDSNDRTLGMYLGFAALTILVIAAVVCALNGQSVVAGGFMAVGAIGTVGKFILGRNYNEKANPAAKK